MLRFYTVGEEEPPQYFKMGEDIMDWLAVISIIVVSTRVTDYLLILGEIEDGSVMM